MTTESALTARSRTATFLVFGCVGLGLATWMSRVPDIRERFHLTPGQLGMLILAVSLGSIVALPLSGKILDHWGTARVAKVGSVAMMTGLAGAGVTVDVAASHWWMAPWLVLAGLAIGVTDVAMNLEGTTVEHRMERAIMPWFHAAFSAGTVLGALLGAGATALQLPVWAHLVVVSVLTAVSMVMATRHFLTTPAQAHAEHDDAAPKGRSAWTEPRTLLVGLMVLAAALTEGSANDWMAVAFVDGHGVSAGIGVLATSVFLAAVTLARVLGTHLLDRFGRVPVLFVMFAAAALGCGMVVFGTVAVAFVGAAVWGIGASLGFPVGMSAASDNPARAAARLSVVSTVGYTAFLAGPALLGFLGNHFGVLKALLAVGVIALLAFAAVPSAKPEADTAHE